MPAAQTVTVGIDRMPTNDRELWHFVRAIFGVTIPNTQVCPNHVPPFRVFSDAYFARYPVIVQKGSRGLSGKSWSLATLANTMAVGLAAQTTILGGSGAQSINVHLASKAAWAYPHAPRGLITGDPTKYDTHFSNGAWIRSLMASQTSVRGPHPQRLILDEVDEMDLDVLEAAQGQPMMGKHGAQKGLQTCTVMSSTHQYADGTMTAIIDRAYERGWPVYEVCVAEGTTLATLIGTKEIQAIEQGDMVLTRDGWRPVQHVTYMGVKPTVTVEWEDGSTLVCTPDHKIATSSGWVEAGLLQPGISTTLTATPVPLAARVGVLDGVLMSMGTVGGEIPSTSAVDPVGNVLQMAGADAVTGPAGVVDLMGDVAVDEPVHGTVSTLLTKTTDGLADDGVPVTALGKVPSPASVLIDGRPGPEVVDVDGDLGGLAVQPVGAGLASDALDPLGVPTLAELRVTAVRRGLDLPVWDVGVHGCHEFTLASGQLISNCYRESMNPVDGWLTPDEVERKKSEIPIKMWETEYELQEPSIEGRAIDTDAVERTFDPAIGQTEGTDWVDPGISADPKGRLRFVTGVDWAKEQDRTVITTFLLEPDGQWRCVAWSSMNRAPWPVMVAIAEERLRKYPDGFAHDATGLGNVIADYFDPDLRRRSQRTFKDVIMGSGRSRQDLFSNYISAIESDRIRYPRVSQAYREHLYCIAQGEPVLTSAGEVPIEQVEPGMSVATRKGWRTVQHRTLMGRKRVITITVDGRQLTLTPDHKIATPSGWVEAGTLAVGDLVHTVAGQTATGPAGLDAGVLGSEGVSTLAVGGDGSLPPGHVGGMADRFQMVGVAAGPMSAQMVDLQAIGDRSLPDDVGKPMGELLSADVEPPVAQTVDAPAPDPAVIDLLPAPADDVLLVDGHGALSADVARLAPGRSVLDYHPTVGAELVGLDGGLGTVTHVDHGSTAHVPVYDLGVEGVHEFVASGVVVHNCTWDDLFGRGHAPDSFVAGAIAWSLRDQVQRGRMVSPVGIGKNTSSWDGQ